MGSRPILTSRSSMTTRAITFSRLRRSSTSSPPTPFTPGSRGRPRFYTKEYFELCKRRLNPGGLITQWVPLYESDRDVVRSEIATFFEVFPGGTIWCNDQNGSGYDIVLLSHADSLTIDPDELFERLKRPELAAVAESLENVGFQTVVSLLATYGGQASDLSPWLENALINRDRNLRLQYLAGMELNKMDSGNIHEEMLSYRRFPDELFTGSGWRLAGTAGRAGAFDLGTTKSSTRITNPLPASRHRSDMLALTQVPSPSIDLGQRSHVGARSSIGTCSSCSMRAIANPSGIAI